MEHRILGRANKRLSLGNAALLLSSTALIGTFLGLLRTKLINANFNNFESDAYFAAFQIPDFVYFTLTSGALGVAFLPILSERLHKSKQTAWEISSYILNALAVVAFFAALFIMIFAQPLLKYVVVPGFTPAQLQLTVAIMRIISVNIFLFAISTVLITVQQAFGRFFFVAIAPLFYNGCIIASIFIFGNRLGIVGLGIGVAFGAVLQLLIVGLGMIGMDFRYRPKIDIKDKGFRQVLKILPARSIDQGIDYIESIAETRFASLLSIGSVTNYENAVMLYNAPVALIGTAISTAAFPRLTDRLSQGRPDLFRKDFLRVLRTLIWIAMPVAVLAFFVRDYLARLIFARNNHEIAIIFGCLCVAIFFRILYSIISRYFYAHKDTKTPLYVSLFVIALNIILAYSLSKPYVFGVAGLAIAQSIVAFVEVSILASIMAVRDRHIYNDEFVQAVGRITTVTGISALTAFLCVQILPLGVFSHSFAVIVKLTVISFFVLSIHVIASFAFGLEEATIVINRLKRIVLRPVRM